MMRVRFPYTARYDSMPVGSSRRGSHDHVDRVRYPRLRLFDGHADIAGAHHSRMMRTALRRKGRRESDLPIRQVRTGFPES